jgi:hypothetical protein
LELNTTMGVRATVSQGASCASWRWTLAKAVRRASSVRAERPSSSQASVCGLAQFIRLGVGRLRLCQ